MKYTALTIGPLGQSLAQAHKTREIWAASFLFSNLMEDIIRQLLQNGIEKAQFILPYPKVRELSGYDKKLNRAGFYSDQLILKSATGLFDELQSAVNFAVNNLAQDFNTTLKLSNSLDYLKKYLRTDIIQFEAEDNTTGNILKTAKKYLDNCELQNKLIAKDDLLLTRFFEKILNSNLFKTVFDKNRAYPSILEIGIRKINDGKDLTESEIKSLREAGKAALINEAQKGNSPKKWDDDDKLLKGLKLSPDYKDKFKTAHKYIAIVKADGDNVGKIIKSIYKNDKKKIGAFQRVLASFSLEATKTILNYGGEPIYAGGDDLLFFAPVVTPDSNIIGLLQDIDANFKEKVIEAAELSSLIKKMEHQPSMSYGLSVTYYKFPMHEALNSADELLFKKAKNGSKNAIAYRLQKHSGQAFDDVLDKNAAFFEKFTGILKVENLNLISSLLYNLERQKTSLEKILEEKEKTERKNRLKAFFKNTYNEDIHKTAEAKAFVKKVRKLLQVAYTQTNDIDTALNKVYPALRFVKFLNRKHHD